MYIAAPVEVLCHRIHKPKTGRHLTAWCTSHTPRWLKFPGPSKMFSNQTQRLQAWAALILCDWELENMSWITLILVCFWDKTRTSIMMYISIGAFILVFAMIDLKWIWYVKLHEEYTQIIWNDAKKDLIIQTSHIAHISLGKSSVVPHGWVS